MKINNLSRPKVPAPPPPPTIRIKWSSPKCPVNFVLLFFSDRSENQDRRPGLRCTGAFSISSLQPLNRIQCEALPSWGFFVNRKSKMSALASSWPGHYWLLLCTPLTMTGSKISTSSSKSLIGKPRWPPWSIHRQTTKVAYCTHVHNVWFLQGLLFQNMSWRAPDPTCGRG